MHFCNWFLQAVHDGVLDPKLTFFTHEAWFHLNGYINAQNNMYWSSINPKQTFEVCPFTNSMTHIFLEHLIQSGMSLTFLGPFLRALWKKKRHGYFMQDGATAHTLPLIPLLF
jgi:hypothetical protein